MKTSEENMITIDSLSWSSNRTARYLRVPRDTVWETTSLRQSFDFRISLIEVYRFNNLMVYYKINYNIQNAT